MKQITKQYGKVILAGMVVCSVFGFTMYQFYRQSRIATNHIIVEHMAQLHEIFQKIDATAGISEILHQRNYIDFLNVRSFSGSEVGSLNLFHPEKWQGPYLNDNFTVQGKMYEIVKTKSGYYIVPGQGVKLANGKVIGRDIIIDTTTDMEQLLQSSDLMYEDAALAVKFPFEHHVLAPTSAVMAEEFYDEEAM